MADKQVDIEVVTNADLSSVEDLQTVLEETEASAETLGDTISQVDGSSMEDAAADADELASSADGAADSIDGIQASLDVMESGALLSISGELSSIGTQAEGMSQQMNTAAISVGQLATNVGMAEPQMVGLINTISNATFPQEEAMAYVGALNQMGVSADKLGESATNMDRINDATGIGYGNVMQLTQGLRSVGVEADNLPSAFNAIAYAQANVNGGAQTMSQVFKRQASTINEYGLSVDQTVLIMQRLSEQGVQGMKMGSELSKVLKENNGDIRSIEQSLGMQSGALSNASAETGKYEGQLQSLADEEAEHKTIIDQLGAAWEDLSLSMNPVMAPMASIMGLIGNAGSFAVGINGLVTLAQSMQGLSLVTYAKAAADGVAAAAQWALNIAMSANPIGLVIIAIVALIAILGYLYFNNEQVRNAVNALGQALIWVASVIVDTATNAVSNFTSTIASLPGRLSTELNNMLSAVNEWASTLPQKFWDAGVNAVKNFLAALGIASPGTMQRMLVWEISEMGRRTPVEGRKLLTNISSLGSDIVDEFGNPTLGVGFETMNNSLANPNNGYGQVINLNVEVGTVDNTDRVQEIVDTIRRELAWNNTTAGRTA